MSPNAFILIGRSGCGKGTQSALLGEYLKNNQSNPVLTIETGVAFRDFISSRGYANSLSKEIYESGVRQPSFLACYMWTSLFLEKFTGTEHVILDGTPRARPEAEVLETAMKFFKFQKAVVIHLDVSREWSIERLSQRRRDDDKDPEEVLKRLDWFDADVVPAINYFKESDYFDLISVNGEQPVDLVHSEILEKLRDTSVI